MDIMIYTDGSCVKKIGGYSYIVLHQNNIVKQHYGRVPFDPCTNQIAELYAIKMALYHIHDNIHHCYDGCHIIIRTDSQYAIDCLTKWIIKWKTNGFLTFNKKPVKNKELIIQCVDLLSANITFEHVYAHRDDQYNNFADKIANLGREKK
ncbi:MAG TPA: ribonuclease H family protein [Candidatus Saccharimonadales bacterium]|nr:ribonuclease H family protein [Candidatus Saccharimonadales bacterium]